MYLKNQIVNDFSICCPGSISVYNLLFIVFGHIFLSVCLTKLLARNTLRNLEGSV